MNELSDAKQSLLRALESIETVEQDMGGEVRHLCVVYSVVKRDEEGNIHEEGGWNHSEDPDWLVAAMLRRAATYIEGSAYIAEIDDPDEPQDA